MENNNIPNILTQASKEKFRRRLMIASRVIAVALILAIIFIGFIQIRYVKEFNDMRAKYGSKAFCYYCGLENARSCTCNYLQAGEPFDDERLKNIAFANIQPCEDRNNKNLAINISDLNVND